MTKKKRHSLSNLNNKLLELKKKALEISHATNIISNDLLNNNINTINYCENISLKTYVKKKSKEVNKFIKEDLKNENIINYLQLNTPYKKRKFKNYVKKHLKKYVTIAGQNSNNYNDYLSDDISTMIYQNYPNKIN